MPVYMSMVCGIWGLIDSEGRGSERERGMEERREGYRNRKKGRKKVMMREGVGKEERDRENEDKIDSMAHVYKVKAPCSG